MKILIIFLKKKNICIVKQGWIKGLWFISRPAVYVYNGTAFVFKSKNHMCGVFFRMSIRELTHPLSKILTDL